MERNDERHGSSKERRNSADGSPVISVTDLTKTYGEGDDAVRAVDGVSFDIEQGTAVGLLGPNGAGKTTVIKSLLGLIIPTEGHAEVCGVDVTVNPSTAYRHVGAMLEGARNTYWRLTVRENLRFFATLSGEYSSRTWERHEELLEQFNLTEKADTPVRDLSRGMKQKVSLASTLARNADVVFLDEPTLGLDVESSLELRHELRRLVDKENMTILLSSHDMSVIEDVCDRVIIMDKGETIADETVEQLLGLFHTRAYKIITKTDVSEALRTTLQDRFGAKEFTTVGERESFEVAVSGEELHSLVAELQQAGQTIYQLDVIEPDLEDVFLDLTNEGDVTDKSIQNELTQTQ